MGRIVLAAALLLAAPLWAGTVTLKPDGETAGPYVRLGDVAQVLGDPLWESIFLGPAPAAGESRRVTRGEVMGRLAYLGIPAEVDGAEETLLRRAEGGAPQGRDAALRAEISGRLEAGWALEPQSPVLPAGWASAELLEVSRDGDAVAARLRGAPDGEEAGERVVRLKAIRLRRVVSARRELRAGQRPAAGDLEVRELPEGRVPRDAFRDPALCVGRPLLRGLAPGAVLTPSDLQAARAVSRGSLCVLAEREGRVRIRCQGRALADGRVGETIPFEVLDSKKVLRAMVRGEGEADLCLEEER